MAMNFLVQYKKHNWWKKKIGKLDFIKIKNFYSAKDTVKRIKRQGTGWEKILTKHIADKGLVSKIYKGLLKLINKKTNSPVKHGQKIWTNTLPTMIHRRQVSMGKDSPRHTPLGNCKLKHNKIRPHTYQNGENPRQWHHWILARRWSNRYSHFGRQFGSFSQS